MRITRNLPPMAALDMLTDVALFALAYVERHPGSRARDVAECFQLPLPVAVTVMTRLFAAGFLQCEGNSYFPKVDPSATLADLVDGLQRMPPQERPVYMPPTHSLAGEFSRRVHKALASVNLRKLLAEAEPIKFSPRLHETALNH